MANLTGAISRLGLFGYATQPLGARGASAVVLAQLARVTLADAAVTVARLLDRSMVRVVDEDSAVTGVTITEWPVS